MAGEEGFEPPNARTKTWCLTTWPLPIIGDFALELYQKLHLFYRDSKMSYNSTD